MDDKIKELTVLQVAVDKALQTNKSVEIEISTDGGKTYEKRTVVPMGSNRPSKRGFFEGLKAFNPNSGRIEDLE